jgi:hypothetical protein
MMLFYQLGSAFSAKWLHLLDISPEVYLSGLQHLVEFDAMQFQFLDINEHLSTTRSCPASGTSQQPLNSVAWDRTNRDRPRREFAPQGQKTRIRTALAGVKEVAARNLWLT